MNKAEQWIVSSLLVIALLTFFFPLTTIRVPVLGNMDLSGYDLISKAQVLNHDLDAIGDKRLADMANGPSEAAPIASAPTPQIAMPFSVRKLLFCPNRNPRKLYMCFNSSFDLSPSCKARTQERTSGFRMYGCNHSNHSSGNCKFRHPHVVSESNNQ